MAEKLDTNTQREIEGNTYNLLMRQSRGYDITEEGGEILDREDRDMIEYLTQRKSIQQASRREREKLMSIVEDRLGVGLGIENEQEYAIATDMIRILYPTAKLPSFQEYQDFVDSHKNDIPWSIELSKFYEWDSDIISKKKIAILASLVTRTEFYIGYIDITDGKIHTIEISPEDQEYIDEGKRWIEEKKQEEEEWLQYVAKENKRMEKEAYAPPFVLDAETWKSERENNIKDRRAQELRDLLGENNEYWDSETDILAWNVWRKYHALLEDKELQRFYDYVDKARAAWEETDNAIDFYKRLDEIDNEYPDIEFF